MQLNHYLKLNLNCRSRNVYHRDCKSFLEKLMKSDHISEFLKSILVKI